MDLTKEDVAELLHISEAAVERFAKAGTLPSYEWNGGLRFSREELENWIYQSMTNAHPDLELMPQELIQHHWSQFSLYRAINRGVVLSNVKSTDKESVIREVMERVRDDVPLDTDSVCELLLEREKLSSTAMGRGVAIPHPREIILSGFLDIMVVVFPQQPIDWGSLDGELSKTLFFLFACDDKRHLNLLAKLAHLSATPEFHSVLERQPSKIELLQYVKSWELSIKKLVVS